MAKDPAFLFYPGDWTLGTMHLTLLEKGCYMELLILQFAKGKFTEAQAKHMLNGSFYLAWVNIRDKFETDGNFYWNKRLQVEKEKRQKFTDSRRNNGSIPKSDKKDDKHMLKHMEDENENKDTSTKEFLIPKINSDFVCYDVEDYILNNQVLLEKICMATNKKADEVKIELHMYHLWLTKNEKYPFGKKAAAAGFESWLHNNKKFNNGTGNSKGSAKLGPSEGRAIANRDY